MMRDRGRAGRLGVLALLAGAAVSVGGLPTSGQDEPIDAGYSELGFGEIELPVDLVVGRLAFRARRAWVWRVDEGPGPRTIRLVLDGEVETVVGPHRLSARRAAIWLRPRGTGGVGDAEGVYEVFGYYEDVSAPGGPAGFAFDAENLPVQALIAATEPVRLSVDLRLEGAPGGEAEAASFTREANEAFARALAAIRNPDAALERPEPPERVLRPPAWILERRVPAPPTPPEAEPGAEPEPPEEPAGAPEDEAGQEPGPTEADRPAREIPFEPEDEGDATPPGREPEARPPEREVAEPGREGPVEERRPPPEPGGAEESEEDEQAAGETPPPPEEEAEEEAGAAAPGEGVPRRIFSGAGVFFLSAGDRIVGDPVEGAYAWTATGGVVVQYESVERVMEMTARRAVIFLEEGATPGAMQRFDDSNVLGVYLEGGARVSDGEYTLRSPRVYYDVRRDRAILLDAVFRTYDRRVNAPLYMRAEVIRQEAADTFSAEKAVYANTGFATPHLAVGTSRMTISERSDREGHIIDARGVTLRAGGVPVLWWPWYRGDPERVALQTIGFENSNRTGPVVLTAWDPFTLLGIDPPRGVDGVVNLDYYADRGPGLGTDFSWSRPGSRGGLLAYLLPSDDGTDVLTNGTEIERDGETRGLVIARHMWRFRPEWTAQLDGFHASDEGLLPALFRDEAEEADELTTRGYLRRLEGDSLLTLEAKVATTDFVPNEHLAQSPGYMVDKLPEVEFARVGDDPLEEWAPGWLTHTWSAGVSRMRFRFAEIRPEEIGLTRRGIADRAFGVDADEPIASRFRDAGLDEDMVTRADTRHELSTKASLGALHINPYLVGRATAYDTDFDEFSPDEGDSARLWGAAGLNLSTSIYRIDNRVDSRAFDLHRIRHIIEPSLSVWQAGSTIDEADLPVYDDDVESLAAGTAVRTGVSQTWQTKRGAPGRWRTVDVFTLDAHYHWFSDDVNETTPIGRWYSARPELGSPDEFVRIMGTWQATEVVGLTAETIWDADEQRGDRNAFGVAVQHSERLWMWAELRRLEDQDDTFGSGWIRGTFGEKYVYLVNATYNFRREDFQNVGVRLLRRFPNGLFGGTLSYNNISGETSFGLFLQPTGGRGGGLGGRGGGGLGG